MVDWLAARVAELPDDLTWDVTSWRITPAATPEAGSRGTRRRQQEQEIGE
jgi:hypothetical protein